MTNQIISLSIDVRIDSSTRYKYSLSAAITLIFSIILLSTSVLFADSTSISSDTLINDTATDSLSEDAPEAIAQIIPETSEEDISAFRAERLNALIFMVLFSIVILIYTNWAKSGKQMFIRKINGLDEVEEAVGRATEMGKPVLFIPGLQELDEIETIAGISILGRVARITARYDTPLLVPVRYPLVLAAGQEVVEQAYIEAGNPDAYNKDMVRYVAGEQFAYTATVNGMMMRERPATNIYMGAFFAESLLLAETGNAAGSIQIAGTAQPAQLPFFVAACDYTLMGEELYAASAYLSREPLLLGGLKGQDWIKILLVALVIIGIVLVSFGFGDWYVSLFVSV
ncbi:MAG: hypothetical protein GY839_15725 [candidate division Zixibacteria bacterium]|nr:hypothetical protein [candidate division Zixibacteria bacterium]